MSLKIDAGQTTRQDVVLIDPAFILCDEGKNGRHWPHGDAEVAALCRSFESEGQLQPVQVRRIADNKVELVLGYRRFKACKLYNELHPDKPMKLKCQVGLMNDEEAFRRNIVENRERAETTPIDDAFNQNRLREAFGWTDTKIADFYNMSGAYVCTLKKLCILPTEIQEMVHDRLLSVQAAVALSDLPEEDQKKLLVEMKTEGNVSSNNAIKKVREKKIDNGGSKSQARSMKEFRGFLEGLTGPAEPPAVKALAEDLLKYIQGKIKDETMEKRFRDALKTALDVPAPVPAVA